MSYFKGEAKQSMKKSYSGGSYEKETVEDVLAKTFIPPVGIPERGLKPYVVERFGIRVKVDNDSGEPLAHYFPITKDNVVTGFVRRDLVKPKKDAWSTVGTVSVESDLFGTQVCAASKNGRPFIFVTEGMYDAPSLFQVLHDGANGKADPHVVSINLGTMNALENCINNQDFLTNYKQIRFSFDNDKCTEEELAKKMMKGHEATKEVSLYFQDKCVYLPLELKDPNEYIKKEQEEKLFHIAINKAKEWTYEQLTMGAGVTVEQLSEAVPDGARMKFAPKIDEMLGGFRPYEWTILMAPPKAGKTSLTRQIVHGWLKDGDEVVCYASMEDTRVQVVTNMVALDNNVDIVDLEKDPTLISDKAKQETMDTLLHRDKFMMIESSKGHIGPDEAVRLCEYAVSKGATKIVFDHLSYVISGDTKSQNERKAIDKLLTDLEALKKRHPIHILAIAHITIEKRRGQVVDKESGEIEYPYWYRTDRYDGRGSGAFTQLFDNMILVDVKFSGDQIVDCTQMKLALNRRRRKTGPCDIMKLGEENGKLYSISN